MKRRYSMFSGFLIAFTFVSAANAKDFDQCQQEANEDTALSQQINSVPRDDTNRLLRAAIVGIDYLIAVYNQCLPDPRAQQMILDYENQKAQTLANCRAISSQDNCLLSPFDPVDAANQQAVQAATAEAEAERERQEIRDAVKQFTDALGEALNAGAGAEAQTNGYCNPPPGGVCTAN